MSIGNGIRFMFHLRHSLKKALQSRRSCMHYVEQAHMRLVAACINFLDEA